MLAKEAMNYWAILVAAVVGFGIGWAWYHPKAFGAMWCKEAGKDMNQKANHPKSIYGYSFLLTLLTVFALDYYLSWLAHLQGSHHILLGTAICTSLIASIFWVGTSIANNYLFSGRNLRMTLIDTGYYVVQFFIVGFILGVWH